MLPLCDNHAAQNLVVVSCLLASFRIPVLPVGLDMTFIDPDSDFTYQFWLYCKHYVQAVMHA